MHITKDSLTGKVAFVTGVGSGIGKATAELLAHAGARVAGLTLKREEADATAEEIRRNGGEALPLVGNVSDAAQIAQSIEQIRRAYGRLDIVVANAGVNGLWAPLEQISPEEWQSTLDVNLKGTFLTVKYAVPLLKENGGAIVVVASVNGTRMFSNTGASAYATSKAGQVAFARMIALELARHRIRVNTVCPGSIETRIDENTRREDLEKIRHPVVYPAGHIPLSGGKPGSAVQVAQLIWFLVSDISNHITGTEVYIDGGESLLQG
jgi:NAD(P)-dependent dehydrogenase (short-subunit alcohol dehydrogenase family)